MKILIEKFHTYFDTQLDVVNLSCTSSDLNSKFFVHGGWKKLSQWMKTFQFVESYLKFNTLQRMQFEFSEFY